MEALLDAVAASAPATALRFSRWSYAAVNTAHVLGVALLVGAAVPLALRLLGLWAATPRAAVVRILSPVAATGLALAAASGVLLFATRAPEYADLPLFWLKLALAATAAVSALATHAAGGWRLDGASPRRLAVAGAISLACWTAALIAGRLIAFVAG